MIMIGFGMAFVGSQFVTLIFASLVTVVSNDLKAGKNLIWLFSSNLVATGITAPFAGVIADLFGRKPVTITGALGSMVGMILCASTPNANGYIAGQVFVGFGIAIQELMAIAAIAELVPTKQRGFYAAIVVSTFIPFAPASLYGQVISEYNWRWNACFVAIWNFITALIIAIFYNPKARTNTATLSRSEILRQIDYIGGILMTAGLIFLLIGLNWGGQAYPWKTTRVICFVVLGCCLIIVFLLYEAFLAKWPMFPRRLIQHPRPFMALMAVILLAGVNYIPILIFWTMQSIAVYQSTRLETGIRTLPFGCCIMGGSIISAILISSFKGHLRLVMTISCVIQAAGEFPFMNIRPQSKLVTLRASCND
jgi:MFS family permease